MSNHPNKISVGYKSLLLPAIKQSFLKCNPRQMIANPVMFCVEIVTVLCSVYLILDLLSNKSN